ncbi:serine/threonine kinase with two-component sensor domain [Plesiocystis pacifica SIR-1]|uniref:histidine kinase n=1 Tax=Plesiocystis pacifica SIR-1 TaxID=391625 RepID=A6FY34_9BACT|nr:serine/threonine kinase with two-component sensor domain [Plesiocystis pacifica SIR-1]
MLRSGARKRVYEIVRDSDDGKVIAKVFHVDAPGVEARVRHEFRLLESLDIDGVVKPIGLERLGDNLVLLLESVDSRNLRQFAGGRALEVRVFLPVAIRLVEILAAVHERGVIHQDIKPSNVLIERGTGAVHLADFGISVLLEDSHRRIHDPDLLAGTLPYLSPEQTGRTKRGVDFRSDLYSLGVTFYELLTGRRPFEAVTPLEIVHAHLARRPKPPRSWCPALPEVLSAMVMKLLEKAPELRYQSARGLLVDLERLAESLAAGEAEPDFALGLRDHAATLQFPHRLYGRAGEVERLAAALRAVVDGEGRRVVALEGGAGVGKSALVHSLDARVLAVEGELALGRFEAGESPRLYSGFASAFGELVGRVLTQSEDALAHWRERLGALLGPLAGVVAGLVPNLELVLGERPSAPAIEPGQARNRLQLAFGRLLSAFAEAGPLVLVLDDLHHADVASLELIDDLIQQPGPSVLFVLAYRGKDEASDRPIAALLETIERAGRPVERLALEPLAEAELGQLLADVLGRPLEELGELVQLLARKTGNNPLLVRQFLVHLVSERLLEPGARGWTWDLDALAAASLPEDVLGLLTARLDRLPEDARWVLCCAAHLGIAFDITLLARVAELDGEALAAALRSIEREGLIDAGSGSHRFAHEQLQVLARGFADVDRGAALHARIARELLAELGREGLGERLFELVDHLRGAEAGGQLEGDERVLLAELATEAGERALDNAAWAVARPYFEQATSLLDAQVLGARPTLRLRARFGRAQSLALTGDADGADAAFEALLEGELGSEDHSRVVARRVSILLIRQRAAEALEVGLAGLRRYGIHLPARCSTPRVVLWVARAWLQVKSVTREQWLARPALSDPNAIAASRIIEALKSPAYLEDKNLFVVLSGVHIHLGARAQLDPLAPIALSQIAIAAATALRQPVEAAQLCDHALALCEQPFIAAARAPVMSSAALFIWPLSRPFRSYEHELEPLVAQLAEAGELDLGGWSIVIGLGQTFYAGAHLADVIERGQRWQVEVDRWGSAEQRSSTARHLLLARLLTGELEDIDALIRREQGREANISALSMALDTSARMAAKVLLDRFDGAFADLAEDVEGFEQTLFGTWQIIPFAMWAAIVEVERWERARPTAERRRIRRRLRRYLSAARQYGQAAPENFGAMLEILRAESERLRGRGERAIAAYRRASDLAHAQDHPLLEGLACLRLADLARKLERRAEARGARDLALEAMRRLGARAVVARLEAASEDSLTRGLADDDQTHSSTSLFSESAFSGSSNSSSPGIFDLTTVVQTMNLISEDLRLEEVVGRVLDGAVTSAGADRGVLLLARGEVLGVVAHSDGRETRTEPEPVPIAELHDQLPMSVIHYVLRTGTPVILDDAASVPRFAGDSYISTNMVRSLLCLPIDKHERRVGALVLENRLSSHGFPSERLEILRFLVAQAASALDNAQLYDALQRSEARWRSLVSGAPDTILVMDTAGRVEFINHALGRFSTQALVGELAEALFEAESRPAWREAIREAVELADIRERELELLDEAGERRSFVARIAPVDSSSGRLLAILSDVSERKRLEQQVRQNQRLESLGTLAAGVAHEINNPIQGVMGYAELILDEARGQPAITEFATEITGESKRVMHIVRDLLTFSRQEREPDHERIAPQRIIDSTLPLVRTLMRKDGVELTVDVSPELPALSCHPQQIRQVIMNLLTNARDALNDRFGGEHPDKRITIRAAEVDEGGRRWIRFEVEDRGGGIPDAVRDRIFDPFFTTKPRDRGTGLGLSVSHGIAVEHGGQLGLDSEPGVGTTFHLLLPLDAGPLDELDAAQ